jgi:RimJ/RimL family protein N-acetyltransferase
MAVSVGPYGAGVPEVNEFGQPVGDVVQPAWTPRERPARIALVGRYVALQPVTTSHVPGLQASLAGPEDGALWTYRPTPPPVSESAMADLVDEWMGSTENLTWAVVPHGYEASGLTSLYRIDPAHGQAEVAAVVYARSLQRTPATTEATYLLMRYLFDGLRYRRFEWKCDALNEPSRQAAFRLGFTYEGRFRNHMVTKGRNRDTDWFSVTDAEWPRVKQALQTWLQPDNFDDQGRQRLALSEVRGKLG